MSGQRAQINEKLIDVLSICQKINAEKDLSFLLSLITREAANLMEAERASIFLLDRDKLELWSIVTLDGTQIRFDARLGIAGAAAMTGQTINVEDAYQDSRFYKKVDEHTGFRTKSILVVPLKNQQGEIIGTFQVINKKTRAFDKQDEEVLQSLASHVANAVETVRLVDKLRLEKERLQEEKTRLLKDVEERFSTQNILGVSPQIQGIVRLIEQISDTSVNVLITGETGTGKELVAKAIHYNSSRAKKPFVAINCASLPDSIVESELFGIEKGVATGVEKRTGKFEEANEGTLFLDEIGDLSRGTQAKILRALQERLIEPVGGRRSIPIDVRIISATNRDLEREVKDDNFRKDLYYRLRVFHIQMPSLREIPEDIPVLASHFLSKFCKEMSKDEKRLSPGAIRTIMNYNWPGNVRELENEIKRLVVLTARKNIMEHDLSVEIRNCPSILLRTGGIEGVRSKLMPVGSLKEAVEDLEKRLILEALQRCNQNQRQSAKALGLSRYGLIKKIRRYGIRIQ